VSLAAGWCREFLATRHCSGRIPGAQRLGGGAPGRLRGVPVSVPARCCLTPCRLRRRVIGRDPAVALVMRCALIMDVAAGRAYCAALRMIAWVWCRD
jgi:hypothetical protein